MLGLGFPLMSCFHLGSLRKIVGRERYSSWLGSLSTSRACSYVALLYSLTWQRWGGGRGERKHSSHNALKSVSGNQLPNPCLEQGLAHIQSTFVVIIASEGWAKTGSTHISSLSELPVFTELFPHSCSCHRRTPACVSHCIHKDSGIYSKTTILKLVLATAISTI